MQRSFSLLLALWLGLLFLSCRREPAGEAPPNIIFILADDHAAQAIGAYGSAIVRTPHIDRLAANGLRLDNLFCTNAICAPSRAVILTGQHSHRNGVLDNRQPFDSTQLTFPKLLQRAGYQTAVIGKWHLKTQPTGFDYWKILPGQGRYYNPAFLEMGERREYEGYVTDLTTDFALQWLDSREPGRPFFLFLGHKAPHRNWMPGPDHLDRYRGDSIPEPASLFDDYRGRSAAAREQEMRIADDLHLSYDLKVLEAPPEGRGGLDNWLSNRLETLTPAQRQTWTEAYRAENEAFRQAALEGDELTRWKYQRYIQDYLRCIASVDDNTGRLLDYLEESGLADNTLIIYTSDQGFFLGEHGWFDKRFMYEESARMPFLARWPGHIPAGAAPDALLMNLDIAPTLLEAAGLDIPEAMQGHSFLPLLRGGPAPAGRRDATYYHYYEYPGAHMVKRHYGIRTPRYKLLHYYFDIDAWELFDLQADPRELNSVYDDPAYAAVRDSLTDVLRNLQQVYGDDPAAFTRNLRQQQLDHPARGAAVTYAHPPHERYRAGAATALTDGAYWVYDQYAPIAPGDWIGFRDRPADLVLDLGAMQELSGIRLNAYQAPNTLIYFPESVTVYLSADGETFRQAGGTTIMDNDFREGTRLFEIAFPARTARYVRVVAEAMAYIPSDRPGGGQSPWLLMDELVAVPE